MDTNDLNKLKSQNQLHFFHQLALQYFILYLIFPEFSAGIMTILFEHFAHLYEKMRHLLYCILFYYLENEALNCTEQRNL